MAGLLPALGPGLPTTNLCNDNTEPKNQSSSVRPIPDQHWMGRYARPTDHLRSVLATCIIRLPLLLTRRTACGYPCNSPVPRQCQMQYL